MSSRLTVPVWVDEWQYTCCGTDFAVGDRVSWTLGEADLEYLGPPLGPHLPAWSTTVPALKTVIGDDGREVVAAGRGDLVVHLPGAGPSARHTVGLLTAESHGGVGPGSPPTPGRVRSILAVSWSHVERPAGRGRLLVSVPGSAVLTVVRRAGDGAPGSQGFLVALDVAG